MNDNSPGAQGFRTTHTWALNGRPPAPATRRVPSARTSLIVNAHPSFDNGNCLMPNVSDQMKGTPVPFARVLNPTTSPAELMARGAVTPPPSEGSTREPPFAYHTMPMSVLHPAAEGEQADPKAPTRSPALLAPRTPPCRLSSCSTCQEPLTRRQRTGTPELVPPMIVPPPLTA